MNSCVVNTLESPVCPSSVLAKVTTLSNLVLFWNGFSQIPIENYFHNKK